MTHDPYADYDDADLARWAELEALQHRVDVIACSVLGHDEKRHVWRRIDGKFFRWSTCRRCCEHMSGTRPGPWDYSRIVDIRDPDLAGD